MKQRSFDQMKYQLASQNITHELFSEFTSWSEPRPSTPTFNSPGIALRYTEVENFELSYFVSQFDAIEHKAEFKVEVKTALTNFPDRASAIMVALLGQLTAEKV